MYCWQVIGSVPRACRHTRSPAHDPASPHGSKQPLRFDVENTNTQAAVVLTAAQSPGALHSLVHVAPTHVRPAAQPRRVWQQCVMSSPQAAVPQRYRFRLR
jgi:hypothetical protein